jgi:hypothetical protein
VSPVDLEKGPSIPEEPLFPGYVEEGLYSRQHLATLRTRFAYRVGETDCAIGPLVGELESVMRGGDVGLVVLSDHGFLFGEFGFVGKPANTPLPPELHEIICWLSEHFTNRALPELGMQPHILNGLLRNSMRLGGAPVAKTDIHLFARNSPRSNYLAAATKDDIYLLGKDSREAEVQLRTVRRCEADRRRLLITQGEHSIPNAARASIRASLSKGNSPWLLPFLEALSAHRAKEDCPLW